MSKEPTELQKLMILNISHLMIGKEYPNIGEIIEAITPTINKYISENYMTGQQFYDRFDFEVNNHPLANTVYLENHAWVVSDVLEAAKRAAGITAKWNSNE